MMKRLCVLLLAMAVLICPALAEVAVPVLFEDYCDALETEAEWETEEIELIRTLGYAEGVTVGLCLDGENVAALTVEFAKDGLNEDVWRAVDALISLDDETKSALEPGAELTADGWIVGRIAGTAREAIYLCSEAQRESMLWMPVHGGDQIHDLPRCSGMDVARMITPEAAEALGFDNCDTCRKDVQTDA